MFTINPNFKGKEEVKLTQTQVKTRSDVIVINQKSKARVKIVTFLILLKKDFGS